MKIILCCFVALGVIGATAIAAESDGRTVVQLPASQRAMVLTEMRQFLSGLQKISAALAQDDMETVANTARSLGSPMTRHMSPELRQALPAGFRQLGFSVHSDFDQIAMDAESLGDGRHTLSQLGETLAKCVSCHGAYQIQPQAGP